MAYARQDIFVLADLVADEYGDGAVEHVSYYVDTLRKAKDHHATVLWSIVLAMLYHRSRHPVDIIQPMPAEKPQLSRSGMRAGSLNEMFVS